MKNVFISLFVFVTTLLSLPVHACGGFFCELVPINQASEQIIFRQDGNQTTTMVRIFYTGEADGFAWVLPVPASPELSIGSDTTFIELESITRPQFILERTGEACPVETTSTASPTTSTSDSENEANSVGVIIEETLNVGPFDAQIISSDNSDALATWLTENNFNLSEKGNELLQPYIDAQMKFVVLKLQSNKNSGDIKPIIIKYPNDKPQIPIRLTAVAAEDDMGILVWVLGEGRAVPDNFFHVVPNYTKLNWYTGANNAYASYQDLITVAMNEAGGQGFATDMASPTKNFTDAFTTAETFTNLLADYETNTDAEFILGVWGQSFNSSILNSIIAALPLPSGQDNNVYSDINALTTQFTAQQLASARAEVKLMIEEQLIKPLQNSIEILGDDLYLTRLYTTLSADEMLTDPSFVFNLDMPDQAQIRNAVLDASCSSGDTSWTLTLGEGTGRNDSLVIKGQGDLPTASQMDEQQASWQIAITADTGAPAVEVQRVFTVAETNTQKKSGGSLGLILLLLSGLLIQLVYRKA
jgi:hypothetical protein